MKATGGRNRSPSCRTFDREDAGVEFAWRKDRSGKVSQEATGDGGVAVQNPREQDKKRKEGNCDKQGTILEGAHVAMDITGCVEIFTEDMGSAVAAVQNSKKRDVVEVDGSMHVLPMDPGSTICSNSFTHNCIYWEHPICHGDDGLKPSFAWKLNLDGFSPIHLALQNGYIKLVRKLLQFYGDLVRVKGREHITPLHYVVENSDNLDLLDKFLLVCPISIADVAVRNETALHIALKYDNLEAFKFLVRWLGRNCSKNASSSEKPIFNWEDDKW
nr:ankyrin repeat-containing protein bda1 [Quercus suber]